MPTPSISVIMPFRDAAETIDAALDGLLAREDPSVEVLCVDDGSTDGGAARVGRWVRRDARVRLLRAAGGGLVAALTTGAAAARGELIARMDADDISHPERLGRQRAYLVERPEIAVVGCGVEAFADAGDVGQGLARYVAWQNGLLSPADHRRELFVESPLCHPSVMLRRTAFAHVGGYRESAGPEDYELFLRLDAAGFALAKLPEPLLRWRHRSGRATFADPRYALSRLRESKAPFLAARVAAAPKPRRVFWGAGPTGKRLAREVEAWGVRFACFIDVDPRKIGGTARGAPIVSMEALDARSDVVVVGVGARGARELIRPALHARGFSEGYDFWFAA